MTFPLSTWGVEKLDGLYLEDLWILMAHDLISCGLVMERRAIGQKWKSSSTPNELYVVGRYFRNSDTPNRDLNEKDFREV